jgi:hypothetical protein
LTINEGIAIDARLVQSASHPLKSEKLQEEKLKKETPEGKLDKNGNALKFSRWRSISPVLQEYSNLHNAGRRVHGARKNR